MKHFVAISIFLMSAIFAHAQTVDSVIQRKNLEATVAYLASDSLHGRLTGTEYAYEAATYISKAFKAFGLTEIADAPDYLDSFKVQVNNQRKWKMNVVGLLPAEIPNDTMIIFSAHYDHLGESMGFRNQDKINNGANDNASGVAALLELIRYYKQLNQHKYNLCFIAFSAEELGLKGSQWFAATSDLAKVKAVINMDMLGVQDKMQKNKCAVVCNDEFPTIRLMNNRLKKASPDAGNFFATNAHRDAGLFTRSDQFSFSEKVKNSILLMVTSPDNYLYHTVKDEYKTIDFDFLLKTTRNIAIACRAFTE